VVERDGGFLRWEELWSPGVEKLCSEGPPIIESATLPAGFTLPLKLDGHDVLFPALARFSYVVTKEALALACSPERPSRYLRNVRVSQGEVSRRWAGHCL
jgi:hypothetical protein